MTKHMSNRRIVAQLKELRDERAFGNPDERWLASTRETLLMQINNTVGQRADRSAAMNFTETVRFWFSGVSLKQVLVAPLAVLLLMLGAGAGSAALVTAADKTLPGDSLYGVKLLAEKVSLQFASRSVRAERQLEIANRRLGEMTRLAAGIDSAKEAKIAQASSQFSAAMSGVKDGLDEMRESGDVKEAVDLALKVDTKTDEYQRLLAGGSLAGRPAIRLALISLDQASVKALEVLVEKRSENSSVLPEAQLTSAVGRKIETFASHAAATEGDLKADKTASPSSLLLAAKAKEAAKEAQDLLSQGDFRAAVRKVMEGTDLVSKAETDGNETESASSTPAEQKPEAASQTPETK